MTGTRSRHCEERSDEAISTCPDDAGALASEARRRTLADIAKAAEDRELAGEHHVGGALDAVDEALAPLTELAALSPRPRLVA
jgi:hypothetical protein